MSQLFEEKLQFHRKSLALPIFCLHPLAVVCLLFPQINKQQAKNRLHSCGQLFCSDKKWVFSVQKIDAFTVAKFSCNSKVPGSANDSIRQPTLDVQLVALG